jgi:hypothetical protein
VGGINLGSIAISAAFLDALLAEFGADVNDPRASRKDRPALDPEFFTAITVAAMPDPAARETAWRQAVEEHPATAALARKFPDVLSRVRRAIDAVEQSRGRPFRMVAMDFGDQYWGDIGQHAKIHDFYMALNADGPLGEISRRLAGLDDRRDEKGNIIIDSEISPGVVVRNSVVLHARLTGTGLVENSVLIGTRARDARIESGFDVLSAAASLRVEPRGGTYRVASRSEVHAGPGERLTTLHLPGAGPKLFRVHESTPLQDKATTYDVPILGNPCSFREAHELMGAVTVEALREARAKAEQEALGDGTFSAPATHAGRSAGG